MKKLLWIVVLSLLFSSILNTVSFSSHLKKKSKAEKEKYLQLRIVDLPSKFKKIKIAPANDCCCVQQLKAKPLQQQWLEEGATAPSIASAITA